MTCPTPMDSTNLAPGAASSCATSAWWVRLPWKSCASLVKPAVLPSPELAAFTSLVMAGMSAAAARLKRGSSIAATRDDSLQRRRRDRDRAPRHGARLADRAAHGQVAIDSRLVDQLLCRVVVRVFVAVVHRSRRFREGKL